MVRTSARQAAYSLISGLLALGLIACELQETPPPEGTPFPVPLEGSPSPGPSPVIPQSPGVPSTPPAAEGLGEPPPLRLTARSLAFDRESLTASPGTTVRLEFDNLDDVQHNFALYDSSVTEPIFSGEIVAGGDMTTYQFTTPTEFGAYMFICEIHPDQMRGSFLVE